LTTRQEELVALVLRGWVDVCVVVIIVASVVVVTVARVVVVVAGAVVVIVVAGPGPGPGPLLWLLWLLWPEPQKFVQQRRNTKEGRWSMLSTTRPWQRFVVLLSFVFFGNFLNE
jgi:hypothetical protein